MAHALEGIAKGLIEILGGELNDKTIEGTIQVFEGIIQGVHNTWESHLAKETDEVLLASAMTCSTCNTPITIIRTKHHLTINDEIQ